MFKKIGFSSPINVIALSTIDGFLTKFLFQVVLHVLSILIVAAAGSPQVM